MDNVKQFDWSEVLEPAHHVAREVLEIMQRNKGQWAFKFTDSDVRTLTLLYSMVMSNRLYYKFQEDSTPVVSAKDISEHFGTMIQETTIRMTGVDTRTK